MEEVYNDINPITIDYSPFFRTLKKKGMSKNAFMREYEISNATMSRLNNNHDMRISTIALLMKHAGIKDLNEFIVIRYREEIE